MVAATPEMSLMTEFPFTEFLVGIFIKKRSEGIRNNKVISKGQRQGALIQLCIDPPAGIPVMIDFIPVGIVFL